jgi:hypothetical protein
MIAYSGGVLDYGDFAVLRASSNRLKSADKPSTLQCPISRS